MSPPVSWVWEHFNRCDFKDTATCHIYVVAKLHLQKKFNNMPSTYNLLIVYKINKVMQEETNDGLVAMSNISGNAPKNHRQKRGRDDEEDREAHDANLMEMQRI